jgi:hypothetical protein
MIKLRGMLLILSIFIFFNPEKFLNEPGWKTFFAVGEPVVPPH